jgi:hypothetical protein
MIYKSTTIDEVIGRVIRNTRIQDSSYISDMGEWIPEAMGLMQTKVELEPAYEDVQVNFHMGKLPCGLRWIRAVEWNGYRIPENNSSKQAGSSKYRNSNVALASTDGFVTVPTAINGQSDGIATKLYGYELCGLSSCSVNACNRLSLHNKVWYQIEMDYLQFSVPDALVRVHYVRIPLDQNGFPLIPDEENYKQALYFYTRKMMLGAGYEDKAYTMNQLDVEFEKYAARAMGKIRYPSVDSMDMKVERMTRLVPDPNYFNSFFSGTGPEKYYGNTNIINYPNL